MRNFFMLLLLLNLLAFAYQNWILEPDNPVAATHLEQDFPRLTAVMLQRSAVAGPAPSDANDQAVAKCLKIGPISRENDAKSLAAALAERGIEARPGAVEGEVWVGHWVQVVDLQDRSAAEAARGRLVGAGLADAYIVTSADDLKISLGVFRASASADQTVAAARNLGFATRVVERYQPGTEYWLDVALPEGRELRPGELRSDTGQILRTEAVTCEQSPEELLDAGPAAP